MKKLELFLAALLISGIVLFAQTQEQTDSLLSLAAASDTTGLVVPDDFKAAYGAFRQGSGSQVDTIDVGDDRLRVVLKDDHTWYYIKNLDVIANDPIFKEYWKTNVSNPYSELKLSDLPVCSIICLVDSASVFTCPYQKAVFSKFGYRHGRQHQGVDLPYAKGTEVKVAFDGRVRLSMYTKGYGNLIVVRHENGLETYYGHLSSRKVEVGDWVRSGDIIGLGGSTGRSTGPHLHFETRYKGFAFDPQWLIDFEAGVLRQNVFILRRSYLSASSKYVPESIDEEEDVYAAYERIVAEEERIAAERAAMKWHTVRSGETISGIAQKYGKSQSAIVKLNPGLNVNRISIGQKIRVN